MNLNLKDKIVVITGGGAGIGHATAEAFRAEGAKVVVWDVASEPKVDVTSKDSVEAATAAVIAEHGRIDVLVNNAGIVRDAQLVKWKDGDVVSTMDDATFDAVVNVNLKGVFLCTRAVVPHMIRQSSGVILNASSIVGLYGNFGQTNYAATKAGVISFTQTWARELGRFGIRVNAVAPGFIATEMVKAMPQKVLDSMSARTPLGEDGRSGGRRQRVRLARVRRSAIHQRHGAVRRWRTGARDMSAPRTRTSSAPGAICPKSKSPTTRCARDSRRRRRSS